VSLRCGGGDIEEKMVKVRLLRQSDRREELVLKILFLISFSGLTASLHPPDCQWSIQNEVDRLNCLVGSGQNLIVEEGVFGIGPEHAKSLWVKCAEGSDPSSGGGFVLSHGVFMAVPNLRGNPEFFEAPNPQSCIEIFYFGRILILGLIRGMQVLSLSLSRPLITFILL